MKKSSQFTSYPPIKQGQVRGAEAHEHHTVGQAETGRGDVLVNRVPLKRSQQRAGMGCAAILLNACI